MWTKGEGGLFTGSTSEGRANRERVAKVHKAVQDIVRIRAPTRSGGARDKDIDVVINPHESDLLEMNPRERQTTFIRMLKDDAGNVYAWHDDAVHYQVASALGTQAFKALEIGRGRAIDTGEYIGSAIADKKQKMVFVGRNDVVTRRNWLARSISSAEAQRQRRLR